MWCWRRMEKIGWTDHMRNEDVLLRVKEQRNILHEIRKRNANWIGHILRRNCLLQRVIEGNIQGGTEVTGRQGRRRTKLLDDLKERREYCNLKEEAVDRTMWRVRFGRGFGPVIRQTAKKKIHLFFDDLTWRHAFISHSLAALQIWVLLETLVVPHRQSNKLPHPEECEDTLQSSPYVPVSRLDPQPVNP